MHVFHRDNEVTALKITIVSPEFPFSGKVPLVPPILEYLAALTNQKRPSIEVELIDANQSLVMPETLNTDLVAISAMTATAPWAYRFADSCRDRGLPVVMGGIHPSALPEEAALHADSIVVGEAESVWSGLLDDAAQGRMKKFYHGERMPLEGLPQPINGKLKGNYRFRAFFTMRGCPYRCTFCSVRRFFGDTIRYRPVNEVAAEIEAKAGKVWFNGDDNIWGGDIARSTDLFNRLSQGSGKSWYGFGDLKSLQSPGGDKMLAAARRSGLFSVWVGWESDSQISLDSFKASGKQGAERLTAISMLKDAGIDVVLFAVLGSREDSLESFQRILDLSDRLNVGVHPVLLTPLPGTELYDSYREHLLPERGWEYYTGVRALFHHPDPAMTVRRREGEYQRLARELFKTRRILRRTMSIPRSGFPTTHLLSVMKQLPMKKALDKSYVEWLQCENSYNLEQTADLLESARKQYTRMFATFIALYVIHLVERFSMPEFDTILQLEALLFSLMSAHALYVLFDLSRESLKTWRSSSSLHEILRDKLKYAIFSAQLRITGFIGASIYFGHDFLWG